MVAPTGERRRQQLQAWTQAELAALQKEHRADLFRFTDRDPAQTDPDTLFLAPVWHQLSHEHAVPLLTGVR